MPILGYVLLATLSVSFLSLAGLILIWVRDEPLGKFLEYLVGIAVGCLLGGAFLHLLPESLESTGGSARRRLWYTTFYRHLRQWQGAWRPITLSPKSHG